MANFNTSVNIDPDYGLTKVHQPKKKVVKFADGYEHRVILGLPAHQDPRTFNLTFKNVTEAQSDSIESFFVSRAQDQASFEWLPPGESSASNFVCERWTKSFPYSGRATVKATFREVFEP